MIAAALLLPYIGCINMNERFMYGNTLTFGLGILSFLWLGIIKYSNSDLLRKSRTTVILIYGTLALASMILRVVIERGKPQDFQNYRIIMDYTGPIIMSAALIFAAYFSRSLLPSVIILAIITILFPEIKTYSEHTFSFIEWGSGLGTAIAGLIFTASLFYFRRLKLPDNFNDADCYYKTQPFPLRRKDYSLFTIPILFSAVFFCCKIDTYILFTKCGFENVSIKTSASFIITALSWILCSVYLKKNSVSRVLTCLSVINIFLFYNFFNDKLFNEPMFQYTFLFTGLTVTLMYFTFIRLKESFDNLEYSILTPLNLILKYSSFTLAVIVMIKLFFNNASFLSVNLLSYYLIAQLIWHSLETKTKFNAGGFICYWFIIELALSYICYSNNIILSLNNFYYFLLPILLIIIFIQSMIPLFENNEKVCKNISPLLFPFNVNSLFNLIVIVFFTVFYLLSSPIKITVVQQILLILNLFLAARNQGSSILVLTAVIFSFVFLHIPQMNKLFYFDRIRALFDSRDLAWLSLTVSVTAVIIKNLFKKIPEIITGKDRFIKTNFDFILIIIVSVLIALIAVIRQTVIPEFRYNTAFLIVPYISAVSVYLLWFINKNMNFYFFLSNVFFITANIHTINLFVGRPFLLDKGLSIIHIICLGIFLSIILFFILKKIANEIFLPQKILDASITISAGVILFLLTFNYFSNSNIDNISNLRFIASGLLAYCSGLIFRNAAQSVRQLNNNLFKWYNAFYHFGIVMALWCLFLLIPVLRTPGAALIALGMPIIYFYIRAEFGKKNYIQENKIYFEQYRDSAMILCFILLFFYINRVIFQMILFPEQKILTVHYHYHSPVIILISVVFPEQSHPSTIIPLILFI